VPDFLDSASYPVTTFVSKKIVVADGQLRQVIGDLTIRGTTAEVTLSVDETDPGHKDPWGNTRAAPPASAEINRKDFGLTWKRPWKPAAWWSVTSSGSRSASN